MYYHTVHYLYLTGVGKINDFGVSLFIFIMNVIFPIVPNQENTMYGFYIGSSCGCQYHICDFAHWCCFRWIASPKLLLTSFAIFLYLLCFLLKM